MEPNVAQDWLQIAAGILAALGLFFLATGITEEAQDRRIIAPLLGGMGTAVYAFLFDYAFGWPAPGPIASSIIGFALGYTTSAWLLLRAMPNYKGSTSLTDATMAAAVIAIGFSIVCGVARFITSHSLTSAGATMAAIIAGGAVVLFGLLAVLRAKAAWLRLFGLALTLVSIVLLLIPPIADLQGVSIK